MDSCQDLEEIPKPKRPRLEEEEREKEDTSTKSSATESDKFAINFRAFLSEKNVVVKDFEKLLHHVVNVLGAENMADLEELQPDDLSEGLKPIQQRKLLRAIEAEKIKPLPSSDSSQALVAQIVDSDTTHASSPPPMDFEPTPAISGPMLDRSEASSIVPQHCDTASGISVRYIHCQNLFTFQAEEKILLNIAPTTTLEELIALISSAEGIVTGDWMLELFFGEGYPLDPNEITLKADLSKWKITSGTLLYTFLRKKHQPSIKEVPRWHSLLLPTAGRSTVRPTCTSTENPSHEATPMIEFTVHSFLNGTFVVHVNKNGGLKELQEKIFQHTKVPSEKFGLFLTSNWRYLNDQMLQEALDKELTELLMIPKLYYWLGYDYGKCTYAPVIDQTDVGFAKFYSILYYMVRSDSQSLNKDQIAGYVHKVYGCPPMTYALKLLFSHRSLQQFGCWVALIEGFFQLFRAILSVYCDVPDEKVFEFSDYLWGFIIQQTGKANVDEHWTSVDLNCPITGVKIIHPVRLPLCDDVFDRIGVLKRIKANEAVPGCSVQNLKEDDMHNDEGFERLLMCNLFHSCMCGLPILKQTSLSATKGCIRKLNFPLDVTWRMFSECNSQLCVKLSDLESNKPCLVYYKKNGCMVVKHGVQKDNLNPVVYNPLYNPTKNEGSSMSVQKSMLIDGSDGACKKVDIKSYMNEKAKMEARLPLAISYVPTTQVSPTESQTQAPLEAIVVTLDASTSMSEHIFQEKGHDYSRFQAAKDLFDAFLNRTQAYGLHHLVGLITFKSHVTVDLELTERLSSFTGAINSVSPGGRTALYDAIAKACELLRLLATKFPSCKRRILCLTDGEDTRSANRPDCVLDILKRDEVVMDTVLITGSQGNPTQKALSFATGGYCFFPKSMAEATKIFEVETLVSLSERTRPGLLSENLSDYKSLPFTPTNPYGNKALMSNFAQGLEKASFTTTARMVEKSLLLGVPSSMTSGTASTQNKRILRELRQYQNDPHPSVDVYPNEDNLAIWKLSLTGPDNTPYEKGVFLLFIKFPDQYPSKPPEIRFHTPIYHCNINSSGRICHSSLDKGYVPTQTVRGLVDNIYGLLMDPEPADPLDSVLALELRQNKAKYERTAKEMTLKYASSDRQELKRTVIDVDYEVPKAYLCPLTKKLFTDPVITPYGHTYEREALMEYMRHNGPKDPIAQQPLDPSRLTPNSALKSIIQNFKQVSKELI